MIEAAESDFHECNCRFCWAFRISVYVLYFYLEVRVFCCQCVIWKPLVTSLPALHKCLPFRPLPYLLQAPVLPYQPLQEGHLLLLCHRINHSTKVISFALHCNYSGDKIA